MKRTTLWLSILDTIIGDEDSSANQEPIAGDILPAHSHPTTTRSETNGENTPSIQQMAKVLDIPAVPPFSVEDTATLSQRWRKWKKSFEYYLTASGVTDKKQQRALLLHLAGRGVQEIFETLDDTGEDYETAVGKLCAYFEPKKNIPFERHIFRQASQEPTETVDAFVTRLKTLVKTCEYDKETEMIRDQVIDKCNSSRLRRRLLRESDITLDKVLTIARASEASETQASLMEGPSTLPTDASANALPTQQYRPRHQERTKSRDPSRRTFQPCFCCGSTDHWTKDPRCPANGQKCENCGKDGHFAKVCRSNPHRSQKFAPQRNFIRHVEACDSSDDEYAFMIDKNQMNVLRYKPLQKPCTI